MSVSKAMKRRARANRSAVRRAQLANLLGDVAPEGIVTSSPTVGDDGTIYIGSMDEQLYAITPDGKKAWPASSWLGQS